ncbi:hypothetical protein [Roseburia sp. 1XD42-69]|uniref:hypothetical protein n=1 Tax=Roseburia sp. 1XD42-69 TaxID=2320088 RepID=UPI000EA30C50|nr:hypothetical protein [Roseburia sp. 1XD42-69]RKJ60167.1 hypothetical protein D7Y06_24695 [Roseburia sp. 1XD42-69]
MGNTVEKVIEMPQITEERNYSKIMAIGYEIISMIFEMSISFVPIVLYWLVFYLSNTKVDYFEHIKNGSIIWIFLAMLVVGNFKLLVDGQHKYGFAQRLIIACIIIFMLILLGVYLVLNFATYGLVDISLVQKNTTCLVILLGISTLILNTLRIVFF